MNVRRAAARVLANPRLARLLSAFAAFRLAELAVWIALTAYAFQVGGVNEAAAVVVVQLVPAALFALTVGGLMHRFGATRVLRAGLVAQSAGLAVAAVVLGAGGPRGIAYAGAVLAATTVTVVRPCQSVLTPALVTGPEELTAANIVVGLVDGISALLGPAIAAVLMTLVGSWAVFAVMAVATAAGAALVWRLPTRSMGAADDEAGSVLAGMRAVATTPGPRVLVAGLGVQSILYGALDVLAVVIAVDLLHRPEAFAGWVTAAFGAGMAGAGVAAFGVLGRERLAPSIVAAAFGAGLALVAVSLVSTQVATVLVLVAVCGLAAALYELTSRMLLQRISRLDILGHVFSLVEAMQMAMLAVGSASVPFLVDRLGADRAPAGAGVLMIATVAVLGPALVRIDRRARVPLTEMAALRSTRLLGPLPAPALETLAREARRQDVGSGALVVAEGDVGDDYFVLVSGRLSVRVGGVEVNELGPGEGFGEVALLFDSPRTATVRTLEDSVMLAVDRAPFLTAVTGHAPTLDGAAGVVHGWPNAPDISQ